MESNTDEMAHSAPDETWYSDTAIGFTGTGSTDTLKKYPGARYPELTLGEYLAAVSSPSRPGHGDKEHHDRAKAAQRWFIPLSYRGHDARSSAPHAEHGRSEAMALVLDDDGSDIDLIAAAKSILGDVLMVCANSYNDRNPEKGRRRRLIIPVEDKARPYCMALPFVVRSFNEAMATAGAKPDPTADRMTQLFYFGALGPWSEPEVIVNNGPLCSLPSDSPVIVRALELRAEDSKPKTGSAKRYGTAIWHANQQLETETLMKHYGWEQEANGKWKAPGQSARGSTIVYDDGGWNGFGATLQGWSVGTIASNGSRSGDALDLYIQHELIERRGMTPSAAVQLAHLEAQATVYGYRIGVHTDPEAYLKHLSDHGQVLAMRWLSSIAAQSEKVRQEIECQAAIDKQNAIEIERREAILRQDRNIKEWGGDWLKEVPYELSEVTAWEHVAWHAPGIIGSLVRQGSRHSSRRTLVPLLAGAIASVAYLAQGKFVLVSSQFVTPPSVGIALLGSTGSGKGDAFKLFNKIKRITENESIKTKVIGRFKSGPAVIKFMSNFPEVLVLNEEAGQSASAGADDTHYRTAIAELTTMMTAFVTGTDAAVAASEQYSSNPVHNPCLTAVMASGVKTYLDSVTSATVESGWLGRWLNLRLPDHANINLDAPEINKFSDATINWLRLMSSIKAPSIERNDPLVWNERAHRNGYFAFRFDDEGAKEYREIQLEFDRNSSPMGGRHQVVRAFYARAAEMVSRLSFIAALAKWPGGDQSLLVTADCVKWASLVVRLSTDEVGGEFATRIDETEGTSSAVKAKIKNYLVKLTADRAKFKTLGNKVRKTPDGRVEVLRSVLKDNIKSGKVLTARVVEDEMNDLVKTGIIHENEDLSNKNNPKWISWVGPLD